MATLPYCWWDIIDYSFYTFVDYTLSNDIHQSITLFCVILHLHFGYGNPQTAPTKNFNTRDVQVDVLWVRVHVTCIGVVLSNWRPACRVRPPGRDPFQSNVVHRPVFCCHFYLLSVVNNLTICWTEAVICKYSTTAVGKPSGSQSFNFNYSIFEQFIVIVGSIYSFSTPTIIIHTLTTYLRFCWFHCHWSADARGAVAVIANETVRCANWQFFCGERDILIAKSFGD